jgi:hypothetical protein
VIFTYFLPVRKGRRDWKCKLDKLESADESATGDETIGDAQVLENAVSHEDQMMAFTMLIPYRQSSKKVAERTT